MKKQSHRRSSGLDCTRHLVIYGTGTQTNYNQIRLYINVKSICHCFATDTHIYAPETSYITFRAEAYL